MNLISNQSHVCVLSFENINLEYRVRNQVNILSKFFNVDFVGIALYTLKCHTWSTSGGRIPNEI